MKLNFKEKKYYLFIFERKKYVGLVLLLKKCVKKKIKIAANLLTFTRKMPIFADANQSIPDHGIQFSLLPPSAATAAAETRRPRAALSEAAVRV